MNGNTSNQKGNGWSKIGGPVEKPIGHSDEQHDFVSDNDLDAFLLSAIDKRYSRKELQDYYQ